MRLPDFLSFILTQRITGFRIEPTPHFDSKKTTEWFIHHLNNSRSYVEFGSGGSTILAAQQKIPFISIDSDSYYLSAVQKYLITNQFTHTNQHLCHKSLGLTGRWGKPVLKRWMPPSRIQKFKGYSNISDILSQYPLPTPPDLFFLDGRFRAACALQIARYMHTRSTQWTLIIDDYIFRPYYHVITPFFTNLETIGRMAAFGPKSDLDLHALDRCLDQVILDYR